MHLTRDEVKQIARGDHPDFDVVEEDVDYENMYKDFATCNVIAKQVSTGKFFSINYDQYTSHYGSGESEYEAQDAVEVHLVTKEVTKIVKSWEAV